MRNKGITLISLVITIIILLILSGISIKAITSENGITTRAKQTKEKAEISKLQEELELKKVQCEIEKSSIDIKLEDYINYINEESIIDKEKDVAETGEENSIYITLKDKYVFVVEKMTDTGKLVITYRGIIGKINPIITGIEVLNKDTNSIKIEVKTKQTKDVTYKYYISKENENYIEKEEISNNIYEYTNLEQKQTYKIKVEVIEKQGGKATEEIVVTLGGIDEITESNTTFTYTPNEWTNGNVTVEISTTITGYTLQYKTEMSGYTGETTTWTNYTGAITLTRNQAIYARVVDSTGQSNGYATGNIEKIDKTEPTGSIAVTSYEIDNISVNVSFEDNESGIKRYLYYLNDEYKGEGTSTSYKFTGLQPLNTYTLKVVAEDNAGNKGTATTSAIISNVAKIVNKNRSGYDIYYYTASNTSSVSMPTWTPNADEQYNQDDLIWESATQISPGVWYYRVNVWQHNFESGSYLTHIYDNSGMKLSVWAEIKDEVYCCTANKNSEGYTIYMFTGENSGYTRVRFPTWTSYKDQDDIIWMEGTYKEHGVWEVVVLKSQHNNEGGEYITHVYGTKNNVQTCIGGVGINMDT